MPVVSRSPVLMFMRAFKRGCAHGRCSRRGYRPDCGLGKAGALEFQNGELQVTTSKIDEDYSLKRMIGQGSFATVYEAVCHQTGTSFACKAVCKEKSPGWRKEVQLCQQASATTQSSAWHFRFSNKIKSQILLYGRLYFARPQFPLAKEFACSDRAQKLRLALLYP